MGKGYVMLVDVLSWVTGLQTVGVRIPNPILDSARFVSVSWEASAGAVNMVPSGSQPSQAPTSAIVCAIVGGSNLSQSAASAPGWFDSWSMSVSLLVLMCILHPVFLLSCFRLSLRLILS